jgi:nitrogenase iron protein NifH
LERLEEPPDASRLLYPGALGVYCVESGGPEAGIGCAGLGILSTLEELERSGIYGMDWDIIIYDVLGDVVCGGFSAPMRSARIDRVCVVTSADYLSLYAANNIFKGVERYSTPQSPLLGGVLHNKANTRDETFIVKDFCQKTNARYLFSVEQYPEIRLAELRRETVLEAFPDSNASKRFLELAELLFRDDGVTHPSPLDADGMDDLGGYILRRLTADEA